MRTETFYYIAKEPRRMFPFPGSRVQTFKKGDSVKVPVRYVDVFLKQRSGLFTSKPPSIKKELKESEIKPFAEGMTKEFSRQSKKKRKQ
jgi:hypothetical protein